MTNKPKTAIIILATIGLLFIPALVNWISDYLFFAETNFTQIFLTTFGTKVSLFLGTFSFAFIFLHFNFSQAIKSKVPWFANLPIADNPVTLNQQNTKKIAIGFSLFFSFATASLISNNWQTLLLFINKTPFDTFDPLFHKDISFYVFSLPLLIIIIQTIRTLTIISLIGSAIIYFLQGNLTNLESLEKIKLGLSSIKPKIRWHIAILLSLTFIATSILIYLSQFQLLLKQKGVLFGASYTDAIILLPILKISAVFAGLLALSTLISATTKKSSLLLFVLTLYISLGLAKAFIPAAVQKFIVTPNELVKETPYLNHHMAATRKAYNLDTIEEKQLSADTSLNQEDIQNNNLTIKNIRLWDRQPLLSTFSQIQEIRTYYDFNSVSNDRYLIDGELRQVMLSPRELDSQSLPTKNWINSHLTFTHGYGITAGPVNQVTTEGLPVLFVKDLPPKSTVDSLQITQPEVYYGLINNNYAIVNTKAPEFDYPKGDEQVYTNYQGSGGVKLDSFAKKLLYAIKFSSLNILLNSDINKQSQILYYRQIQKRAQRLAPFLKFDSDPYMIVAQGKLYWIIDAYTTTNLYPFSQPLRMQSHNTNYIRNSVKVIIDTYNGKVEFYLSDNTDPIISSYAKIFPNTFKNMDQMPKSIKQHLRYPEDIFTLQTNIFTTFHMQQPQIFYNKEDQWEIPQIVTNETNENKRLAPRHMIMKLPNQTKAEYILMLPFTPRAKDNLSAWMVARNDGENYGKLVAYSFPKDKLVFGPKQVIGRINQDAEVSRQITLWDQRGSQVIQGPLLVIPIEESLIYVRPLYLKASDGKIPELKRVIVAYENQIAMDQTLETALEKIFGTQAEIKTPKQQISTSPQPTSDHQSLIDQANNLYQDALSAQRSGNWSEYGNKIRQLGEVLNQLK